MDLEKFQKEIEQALSNRPDGLDAESLIQQCSFESKHQGMLALHRIANTGVIYKDGKSYKLLDMSKPVVKKDPVVRVAPYRHVERVDNRVVENHPNISQVSKKADSEVPATPKKEVEAPMSQPTTPSRAPRGTLHRTMSTGAVAMVLWKYRNSDAPDLSMDRIKEVGNCTSVYQAVKRLVALGYASRNEHSTAKRDTYRWSGKFCYPFNDVRVSDDEYINVLPKESDAAFKAALDEDEPVDPMNFGKTVRVEVPVTSAYVEQQTLKSPGATRVESQVDDLTSGVEALSSVSPTLALISAKIALTESYLQSLRELRASLVSEMQRCPG